MVHIIEVLFINLEFVDDVFACCVNNFLVVYSKGRITDHTQQACICLLQWYITIVNLIGQVTILRHEPLVQYIIALTLDVDS